MRQLEEYQILYHYHHTKTLACNYENISIKKRIILGKRFDGAANKKRTCARKHREICCAGVNAMDLYKTLQSLPFFKDIKNIIHINQLYNKKLLLLSYSQSRTQHLT